MLIKILAASALTLGLATGRWPRAPGTVARPAVASR